MTLIEMAIALVVLLVAAVSVMALGAVALATTENQGHLQARTAEYAQDKMEQLLGLAYCDASSNTATIPASRSGGTGLAGCPANLSCPSSVVTNATGTSGVGGSSDPSNPATGFVDYLDVYGNLLTSSAGAKYMRVWQISIANPNAVPYPNTLKQITVTARATSQAGGTANLPQTTVTALKTCPF